MAIDFPTSPTVGATVTDGTTTWVCVSAGPPPIWDLQPVASTAGGASYGDIFLLGGM